MCGFVGVVCVLHGCGLCVCGCGCCAVWESPSEHGSVCAGGDDEFPVGTQTHAADAAAVADAHMCDITIGVMPHLHQLIITT